MAKSNEEGWRPDHGTSISGNNFSDVT